MLVLHEILRSIVDGVVNTNLLFTGKEEKAIMAEAERQFVEMIKNEISCEFSKDELNDIIANGYAECGSLCICLSYPNVITV
jgi:hypothetical protein